jgi:rare lipoprotein A
MDGVIPITRRVVLAFAALFAVSAWTQLNAQDSKPGFAGHFAPFEVVPAFPDAEGNEVDITTITPPIEKPKPKPKLGTVRSLGNGVASYYGKRFHGRRTANGERFNMNAMTAAHKTLPFGTKVRVTNARNGKSVTVRINDRGPFIRGRTIDLSKAAARRIGIIQRGHGKVTLAIVR